MAFEFSPVINFVINSIEGPGLPVYIPICCNIPIGVITALAVPKLVSPLLVNQIARIKVEALKRDNLPQDKMLLEEFFVPSLDNSALIYNNCRICLGSTSCNIPDNSINSEDISKPYPPLSLMASLFIFQAGIESTGYGISALCPLSPAKLGEGLVVEFEFKGIKKTGLDAHKIQQLQHTKDSTIENIIITGLEAEPCQDCQFTTCELKQFRGKAKHRPQ